jgi:PKD repeat protein
MYRKLQPTTLVRKRVNWRWLLFIASAAISAVLLGPRAFSANPAGGTISEASPKVTWTGPFKAATGSADCGNPNNAGCDNFRLTIEAPSMTFGPYLVEIKLTPAAVGDWDMQVYGPSGNLVDGSGNSPGQSELVVLINPPAGTYTVAAAPFAPLAGTDGNSYSASAEIKQHVVNPAQQGPDTNINYHNFAATGSLGNAAGEPSIGVNWKTNRAMFIALRQTLRITFDDSTIPARATWEDKSFAWTNLITMDPILFTDRKTGRTIVSQLVTPAAATGALVLTDGCSLSAYTDNDGDNWVVDEGCGLPSGADHQSIGGGPFHEPLPSELPVPPELSGYSHATYYCAQSGVTAYCSRSDDGGVTYGPGVPIYTTECGGLHGHPMVGNDGTVYVPNKACGGKQGVVVSEDNGITWNVRPVDGSLASATDPGVGIGAGGTVYLGYQNGDGRASVVVSQDKGLHWSQPIDVGAPYGIKNTVFPRVVAGDDDRAAFAFLGTTTEGPFQDANFTGEWHLYIAHTFNRGANWTTIDATPTDPVQRGCIWMQGGSNPCRNLLDFMGSAVDREGRVLIGYADGCINCTGPSTSRASKATVARQVNGRRLFKQFDPTGEPTPTPTPTPTPNPTPTPDPCAGTGPIVVKDDRANDATDGQSEHDIISTSVAYPFSGTAQPDKLYFTIKVASLSTLTPSTIYFTSFTNNGNVATAGNVYGVRMVVGPTGVPTFESYLAGASNGGTVDGRFVSGTPIAAEPGSGFAPDGTITIVVRPENIGMTQPISGKTLTRFNGAVAQTAAGAITAILDWMPTGGDGFVNSDPPARDDNSSFTVQSNQNCNQTPTPTPTPTPTATPTPEAPRFFTYMTPPGVADNAGEPSIGVNWKSEKSFSNSNGPIPNGGTVMYFGGFLPYAVRVTFDDSTSPATVNWDRAPVTLPTATRVFGDPILFTDRQTGRTFISQLIGLTPLGSTTEYTDDDGRSFRPSEGSGLPSNIDHQTFGGGPYHAPVPNGANPAYQNAVYYCSQSVAEAGCSLSIDGGLTFGPFVPMYTSLDCAGLHGHVKVAPNDGTVYVPNKGCGGPVENDDDLLFHTRGRQAVVVSENNGVTWDIREIPTADTASDRDPSVAVAEDGTLYFSYKAKNGHSRVAVSHDKGLTWINDTDVGALAGVQNSLFQAAVAGDGQRAAVAYFGTTTAGDDYNQPAFSGTWYLYISTTYNGGVTWHTQNVTPGDPIQRGGICDDGTCRNLLDFFDATIDKQGRVLVGYDDGCITAGCIQGDKNGDGKVDFNDNDFTAKGAIARQSGGKRMFAALDPVEPGLPGAPAVGGFKTGGAVQLSWPTPDNGGSTVTAYKVYRRVGTSGSFSLIASVNETNYTDSAVDPNSQNFYRVTAVNAVGEGPYARDFLPPVGPDRSFCDAPGKLVVSDINSDGSDVDGGQQVTPDARVNVRQIYVGEPFMGAGVNKLVFTMQVAPSTNTSPPPSSQWYIIWQRIQPDANFDRLYVAMKTDALGVPSFEYGKFGVPLVTTSPNPNANTPVRIGDADGGSYDVATGKITITLSTSKAENIQAGQQLTGLNGRTFFARPDAGPRSQNISSDITDNGSYTLVGNGVCRVNQVPIARLAASPLSGTAPLTVSFDASASSDPDPGDSIASYTFDFGDGGAPVTQPNAMTSHTYTTTGIFRAMLTVTDNNGARSINTADAVIQVNAPPISIEDTDARVAYSNGWHLINSGAASDGHFRYHSGNSPQHFARLDFNVPSGSNGSITYWFAKSPKGGSADIYLDGVLKQTISYAGSSGSTQQPEFRADYKLQFSGLAAGAHRLEIRNMSGVAYLDRFTLESSVSNAQPASGPGSTTNESNSVSGGQSASNPYQMQSGSQEISIVVDANLNVPFKVLLVDPSGLTLQTVDAIGGTAVIDRSVTQGGLYVIKVVNLSLGPLQITTTATPLVKR